MRNKIKISTEFAYVVGMVVIAIGTALITKANIGVNIVVAPAYILHLFLISKGLEFFTFGVCQYIVQGVLVFLVALVCKKFKISYLFAFVSAVLEGYLLDIFLYLIPDINSILWMVIYYVSGQIILAIGISFMLQTYITPEVYELAVVEFIDAFTDSQSPKAVTAVKVIYDCSIGVLSIILSFILFGFGNIQGLGIGTIVNVVIAGYLIGLFTKVQRHLFIYHDSFNLRKYFK